jgi:excisionase family DNA binding protein
MTINEPISIADTEAEPVRKLRQLIRHGDVRLVGPDGNALALPETVRALLFVMLKNLQAGDAVSIVPEHQQLTTQRAADILGVSRPFLVGMLERGEIPFHMVGSHRRIYLRDLLAYKKDRDAARHEAINRMAKAELEAGTYDKVVLPEGAEDE